MPSTDIGNQEINLNRSIIIASEGGVFVVVSELSLADALTNTVDVKVSIVVERGPGGLSNA